MTLEEYVELQQYIELYVEFIQEHIILDIIRYINESSIGTYEDHVKLVLYLANDIEKQLEKDKNKEQKRKSIVKDSEVLKDYNLHFELYHKGKIVNPEEFYNKSLDEL